MTPSWAGLGALAIAFTVLGAAGCTRTGDLGRPVAPPIDMRSFFAAGAAADDPLGGLALTEDERELRSRAYHFRSGWTGTPTSYYANLLYSFGYSTAGLWGALVSDISDDAELLPPLAEIAYRVALEDRENLASLAGPGGAAADALARAKARTAGNHALIAEIANAADTRIRIYSYAIEVAARDAPDRREREALAALGHLTDNSALLSEVLLVYEGGAAPLPRLARNGPRPDGYGAKRPTPPVSKGGDIRVIPAPPIVEVPPAR